MAEFARAGRVRCFYCGGGSAWFECECGPARLIREGRKAKPKVISGLRGGPLIFGYDPDIRFLPMRRGGEAAGQYMAPAVSVSDENARKHGVETVSVESDNAENGSFAGSDINDGLDAANGGSEKANKPDRKAYMRELMRRKRAAARKK